jgi:hypothetical protein
MISILQIVTAVVIMKPIMGVMMLSVQVTSLSAPFGAGQSNRAVERSQTVQCNPVRILVAQDKSASSPAFRTAQVTAAEVEMLVNVIEANCGGGELAFTIISESSPKPLARLRIPAPPDAPVAPAKSSNIFKDAIAKNVYATELTKYQQARVSWERGANEDIASFRKQLTPLLAQAPDGPRTDLLTALARAAAFFREPSADSRASPRQYLLLISDCEGNVPSPYHPLPVDLVILVVNGLGNIGSLPALGITPIVFEAFNPAARFISERR